MGDRVPARRALIVDDTASVAALVARVVRSAGYDVQSTTRGKEALALLAAEPFDLVVTDYRMPGGSGLDLARQAKALRPGVSLVLMTAFATEEIKSEASEHRLDAILLKPFTAGELRRVIDGVTAALR